MPIDTLKAARRLQEEGTFSPEQAERIAEILSDLDVASATKQDLDDLEARLTSRIDHLGDRIDETNNRIDEVAEHLGERIDETNKRIDEVGNRLGERIDETNGRIDRLSDRIDRLDEKVATKEELKAVKSDLGKQIEETHSATIRTVVGAVAAVGAILAVVIPLAIYLMG